jgi:hypothetical protein
MGDGEEASGGGSRKKGRQNTNALFLVSTKTGEVRGGWDIRNFHGGWDIRELYPLYGNHHGREASLPRSILMCFK